MFLGGLVKFAHFQFQLFPHLLLECGCVVRDDGKVLFLRQLFEHIHGQSGAGVDIGGDGVVDPVDLFEWTH